MSQKANGVCLKPRPPAPASSPRANPALLLATRRACRRVARSPTRCAVTRASVGQASISLRWLSGCYHQREYNTRRPSWVGLLVLEVFLLIHPARRKRIPRDPPPEGEPCVHVE